MFGLTNLFAQQGMFGNNKGAKSKGSIVWHYDGSYMYFDCDRKKNIKCPRVRRNLPCVECKGTKNVKFAIIKC